MKAKRYYFDDYEIKLDNIRYRKKEFAEDFYSFAERRIEEQIKKLDYDHKGEDLFLENLDYAVDDVQSLSNVI